MSETTAPALAAICGWGTPIMSVLALLRFLAAFVIAFFSKDQTLLNILLGAAAANATTVVSYWVGSSAGSARKDMLTKSS